MKFFLLILLFLPLLFYGQSNISGFTFDNIPQNLQLYARSGNSAAVLIDGQYDKSGGATEYSEIKFSVYATDIDGVQTILEVFTAPLVYDGDIAIFTYTASISSGLVNHTFQIETSVSEGPWQEVSTINDVVAGDVYIIQGQSNAVAERRPSPPYSVDSGSSNTLEYDKNSDFIRVFERQNVDTTSNKWYVGRGDYNGGYSGSAGQWGKVLASLIVNKFEVPVAIFNGAVGGKALDWYQKVPVFPPDPPQVINYEKLFYRLNYTGLKEHVKAVFWSQGENTTDMETYYQDFITLVDSWKDDYSPVLKVYIFQTKNGCGVSSGVIADRLRVIKETQRKLAELNDHIYIMPTSALSHYVDDCHFDFEGGYEMFGKRIFELVARDFYNEPESILDIEAPMILKAYMENASLLTVKTNARHDLKIDGVASNFEIANSNGVVIQNIFVDGARIKFELSGNPGVNSEISYLGQPEGVDIDNFVKNNNGLELICFDKYPIDTSLKTIWDGSEWNPAVPVATMDAQINGTYPLSEGSIESRDLTVNTGGIVNFNSGNGGTNNIVVNGDLDVKGTMIIGDTESLVMPDSSSNASVSGTFKKLEKTTELKTQYDVTYFSSPIQTADLASVFVSPGPGVDANRIFHYNPTFESETFTGRYRHWHIASGSMLPGKGYSVDGPTGIDYQKMSVEFEGVPNHGDINVTISQYETIAAIDPDIDKTNLIGNPYPAAIDAKKLIEANSNFVGTLYLWDHNEEYVTGEYTADYITFNLAGGVPSDLPQDYKIASGQGFMILANQPSSQFSFLSSMQVESSNNQFFKGKAKKPDQIISKVDKTWLGISHDNISKKEILITFSKDADKGFNKGYDGKLLNVGASTTFYSFLKNDKYVIQGLNYYAPYSELSLGFKIDEPGQYSIGISKLEGNTNYSEVYLLDRELKINHDLKLTDYEFTQNQTGGIDDRFKLIFRRSISEIKKDEKTNAENNIRIYNLDNALRIRSEEKIEEISVYNILGARIAKYKVDSEEFEVRLPKSTKGSILFLELKIEGVGIVRKKTIML